MLYEKQKRLLNMVEEQIYEKEKNNYEKVFNFITTLVYNTNVDKM